MDIFSKVTLKHEGNEAIVLLYVNQYSTEFGSEFFKKRTHQDVQLQDRIKQLISDRFPSVRKTTVKIMVGSTLIATIPNLVIQEKVNAHQTNFNMSYLYFGGNSSFLRQIEQTRGNVSTTSPSYFDVNLDGTLKLTNAFDPVFIKEMHNKGIEVVPFLSNHWDRELGRAALKNREQLSTEIANVIEQYDLDGINVDIENVSDVDRDQYTDFVRLLREKIPKDKEVSVAVAANPNAWVKGWHGSYDYQKLAIYSDYLMIMAYDESYQGGPEGPVASYPWVKRSIEYALNQGVPSEKIVLGLPFYGRYWKEGEVTGGYGLSKIRVEQMLAKYESSVIFDEVSKSPKAIITIKETDDPFKYSNTTLGPGTYHIWYENEESIKAKVGLVHLYNLKGTGNWSLGQESPRIWNNFNDWLVGHANEVETLKGWVKDGNTWYYYTTNGIKKTGWFQQNGKLYYLDRSTGAMKVGWLKEGGKWFYLQPNGEMKVGWLQVNKKWYYFNSSGIMKTGWLKDSNKWYYLDPSGAMQKGWLKLNDKWYYLNADGAMQTGWKLINGKWNLFSSSGIWIR